MTGFERIETRVVGLDGSYALVAPPEGGCGRCGESGGCGGQHIQLNCSSRRAFRVLNTMDARPGDRVVIVVARGVVSRSAFLLYGFPLLALLLGALLGHFWLQHGDWGAVAGALSGLLVSWFFIAGISRKKTGNLAFQPYIHSRAPVEGS